MHFFRARDFDLCAQPQRRSTRASVSTPLCSPMLCVSAMRRRRCCRCSRQRLRRFSSPAHRGRRWSGSAAMRLAIVTRNHRQRDDGDDSLTARPPSARVRRVHDAMAAVDSAPRATSCSVAAAHASAAAAEEAEAAGLSCAIRVSEVPPPSREMRAGSVRSISRASPPLQRRAIVAAWAGVSSIASCNNVLGSSQGARALKTTDASRWQNHHPRWCATMVSSPVSRNHPRP